MYDGGGAFIGHGDVVLAAYSADGSEADKSAALADLSRLTAPATVPQIEAWLAELSVIAPKRAGSEFEEALRLTAYVTRLQNHPADVVRYALLERPWRFWPSWAELEVACNEAGARRRAILAALARANTPQKQSDDRRERVSPVRAGQIVAEIFGDAIGGAP